MRGKVIVHQDRARGSLLRGVDLITNLVGPTLGPLGRHVVLQRFDAPPLVTNDGVTIARSVEMLQDPVTNQGVQLLREVASTAEDFLGDGTTTAMLLARAILHASYQRVVEGASPEALCRGVDAGVAAAGEWIRSQARPADGRRDLARVATIASRDGHIGELVADALIRVGADGLVRIEDDRAYGIKLEFHEGMRFDNGLLSPGLASDPRLGEAVFEQPYILVADERITQVRQLVPVLSAITEERAPLLIVADEVSGDALTLLVLNVTKRRLPAVAVKAPAFGPDRTEALRDIAVLTGAEVLGPGTGRVVESAGLDQLGRAERVIATRAETTIVGGHGEPASIAARARQAEAGLAYLQSEYEREKRRLRLARLAGAVAIIRVGLDTQAEQQETRHRIRDAVQAGRAALTDGIVPGGGTTLLRAAVAIQNGHDDEEASGRAVVRAALEAPLRQLAANAGIDPSLAVTRVRSMPPDHGLDIETDRQVDLVSAGIFDPAKIVRSTLEIAASVARACLRADVIIANQPSPRQRRRGHGHSHDHHNNSATEEAAAVG
ncbi:MAG: chaperonin GroEL [Thermoleophilaceae bacterium]|nr:chaperonin GroEL [Thermoleophilaceae bacterium]